MSERNDKRRPYMPPLHEQADTLTCHRQVEGVYCGDPADWHLSWYDDRLPAVEWENSLSCHAHRLDADRRGWAIGWRHKVLPACGLPGSRLVIADEGDDEDGFPVSFCFHPLDAEAVANEVVEITRATGIEAARGVAL